MRLLGRDIDEALGCRAVAGGPSPPDGGGDDNEGEGEGGRAMSVEERVALMKSNEDRRCPAKSRGGGGGSRINTYHRSKLLFTWSLSGTGEIVLRDRFSMRCMAVGARGYTWIFFR